jgi:hypothetical protein
VAEPFSPAASLIGHGTRLKSPDSRWGHETKCDSLLGQFGTTSPLSSPVASTVDSAIGLFPSHQLLAESFLRQLGRRPINGSGKPLDQIRRPTLSEGGKCFPVGRPTKAKRAERTAIGAAVGEVLRR